MNIKDIRVDNIEDFYDLPIDASMNTDFWTEVSDVFLLSFGRMMLKNDLGLESFDLFLNLYKNSDEKMNNIDEIDSFIENYITEHDDDFTRTNTNELVPIEKHGLFYSSYWGDYV